VRNALSLRILLAALVGWLDQRQQEALAYLIEEHRILRAHVRRRIRLTDEERRRLAVHGHRLAVAASAWSRRSSRPTRFSGIDS
jgi:hypothetical protein